MFNRLLTYAAMFLACFAGVFAALYLHDRLAKPTNSLERLANYQPIQYEKQPGQVAFADAVQKVRPAVVSVFQLRRDFFSGNQVQAGIGSGVIISNDGYIVTNNHVIEGADAVVVKLQDGSTHEANIVGADRPSDLALLKINATDLPFAELGDSAGLVQGEWVFAIGAPLGIENTLSVGVVSALNRDLPADGDSYPLVGAIQTDAAINQGNSGGPLANVHGQVVGINTAILSPTGGSIGLGFAIPAKQVLRFVEQIRTYGRMRHPTLFIRAEWHPAPRRDPYLRELVGDVQLPDQGLVVLAVKPQGPADEAGLQELDIITKINNQVLRDRSDFLLLMMKAEVGEKIQITFWRGGQERTTEATLQDSTQ
ncbi:MAG: trypsin-like peptidase domain-containing protein [Armatimonadota bacterium]